MVPDDAAVIDAALHRSLHERSASRADVDQWLAAAQAAGDFAVEQRPLEDLDSWSVDPDTHDIAHDSGRFFAVRGAAVTIDVDGQRTRWQQPVILQPDVGVLGLVAARIDGVIRFLVQAKMEPGNRRLVQVSPTVQATASNFERVHRGDPTPFLEHFHQEGEGVTTLVDRLQTEQANRYLRKRNRNVIVVVPPARVTGIDDRFRWLTLADLVDLAAGDDLLHMDTRSILGSLPLSAGPQRAATAVGSVSVDGVDEIRRWHADLTRRTSVHTEVVALREVAGWSLAAGRVATVADPSAFTVLGVRVRASHREVTAWDQPLVHNAPGTRATLVVQRRGGVLRVLVAAATGLGVREGVEFGPSIVHWPAGEHVVDLDRYADEIVDAATDAAVRFDNSLPEEGGRFFHSSTWHRIVELDEGAELPEREARRWLDLDQIRAVGSTTSLLNMELRSLLACLPIDLRTTG